MTADRFPQVFDGLAAIGHDPATGGFRRFGWTDADRAARRWFEDSASDRGMSVETDRNGNLWAWWGNPGPDAVATGSHLDTVPGGGAFDGALGIVCAFLAIDRLRDTEVRPRHPIAIVAFVEEEGSRFGIATLGSRLMTGAIDPAVALERRDSSGISVREAAAASGADPGLFGPDGERLAWLQCFVELHIEQGRELADEGVAIGVGTGIWPHGRWRFRIEGTADHAGTARIVDRHDPALVLAAMIGAARRAALRHGGVATVGRIQVVPNGSNVIASSVDAWLDVRATSEHVVRRVVEAVDRTAHRAARAEQVRVTIDQESWTPAIAFDEALRTRVTAAVEGAGIATRPLATAAGHDAGILASVVPTTMLFVRNPTGISHSPAELATDEDCLTGVKAFAAALAVLTS